MSEITDPVVDPQNNPQSTDPHLEGKPSPDEKNYSADYVRDLRNEAATNRVKAKEIASALSASEAERETLSKEVLSLREELKDVRVSSSVVVAAVQAGVKHPNLLLPKIDRANLLKEDGSISIEAITSQFESLKTNYPELFPSDPVPGDIDAGKRGKSPLSDAQIASMNMDDFATLYKNKKSSK